MSKDPISKGKSKAPAKSKAEGLKSKYAEMKTSEIRDLIDFISQSGLNEVNIETKELKLHVKREPDQKVMKSSPAQMVTMQAAPMAAAAPVVIAAAPKAEKPLIASKTTVEIKSPMIGTFYRSSNPDTPPLVGSSEFVSR